MSLASRYAWFRRGAFTLLCAVALMACGLVISFDDYDTTKTSPLYSVSGTVEGLAPDALVTLTLNTADQKNGLKVANTRFAFPERLADGQSYVVRADAPAGHTCSIVEGSGAVAGGDVTNVAVTCASDDASLVRLTATGAELEQTFDPARSSYDVHVPAVFPPGTTTVTATVHDPRAHLMVADVAVASGTASVPIPVLPKPIPIEIVVTASNGTTKKLYTLGVSQHPGDYVKASNTRTNGQFGYAVAPSGDTLAVGSFGDASNATGVNGNQADTSASSSGAVYVFTRSGAVWSQQAYVKASNTRPAAFFGSSDALSPDGNTLTVGASGESSRVPGVNGNQADTSAPAAGAVYVFTRSGAVWSQQAYIKASNTRADAYFGASVSLSGDTLAVGSSRESSNDRHWRRWPGRSPQAYIKPSNTRAYASFGYSVALSGAALAVGSIGEGSGGSRTSARFSVGVTERLKQHVRVAAVVFRELEELRPSRPVGIRLKANQSRHWNTATKRGDLDFLPTELSYRLEDATRLPESLTDCRRRHLGIASGSVGKAVQHLLKHHGLPALLIVVAARNLATSEARNSYIFRPLEVFPAGANLSPS